MATTYIDKRCRVVTSIRDYQTGEVLRGWTGVIRSHTESCGRMLLLVQWDNGKAAGYVFPEDIELLHDGRTVALCGHLSLTT
jgi:hypothetical protein